MMRGVVIYNSTKRDIRVKVEYVVETEDKFISSGDVRSFTTTDIEEGEKVKVYIFENEE